MNETMNGFAYVVVSVSGSVLFGPTNRLAASLFLASYGQLVSKSFRLRLKRLRCRPT